MKAALGEPDAAFHVFCSTTVLTDGMVITEMMLKKNIKTDLNLYDVVTDIFILFVFGLFPLIYHDNYIDIQTFKSLAFRAAALCYLIVMYFIYLLKGSSTDKTEEAEIRRKAHGNYRDMIMNLPGYMYFLILFLIGVILSTAFSRWPVYAINGSMGRNVGSIDYLLCGAVCIVLSIRFHKRKLLAEAATVLNSIAFILIILNFWGIDPLGMYENLVKGQYKYFIGTIGNVNAVSAYLCIVVPVYLAAFFLSKTHLLKMMYGAAAVIGFYAGFASSSDSFFLGLGAAFLTIFYHSLSVKGGIRKLAECLTLFAGAAVLFKLSLNLADHMSVTSIFLEQYQENGLLVKVLDLRGMMVMLFVVLFVWILSMISVSAPVVCLIRRLLLFAVIAAAAGILLVNLFPGITDHAWSGGLKRFVIGNSFGTGRGYVWKKSLEMWKTYSFLEKLFGCGTDCFYLQMVPVYGEEMTKLFGAPFMDAHCEFLQMLLTTGLVGTIGYAGFLTTILISAWGKVRTNPVLLIGTAMTASYLAQGLVNSSTPACTPVIFAGLGIVGYYLKKFM